MPYSPAHKRQTRLNIVRSARRLFNRHGFTEVSIDQIMAEAGLTRGGFYNHFANKEELYIEVMEDYAEERREAVAGQPAPCGTGTALEIARAYMAGELLDDIESQCPLVTVPSDVSRTTPAVRAAYQRVFEALAGMFQANLTDLPPDAARREALNLGATCVGAMVLARTVEDRALADEIREAALVQAEAITAGKAEMAA